MLKIAHVALLCLVVLTISALHAFPSPFLDFLRMPSLLRLIDPLLGNVYPLSFYAYHAVLQFFLILVIVDLMSFQIRSRALEAVSAALSFAGAFVAIFLVGLFLRVAILGYAEPVVAQGMFAYLSLCAMFFGLDIATFFTEQKMLARKAK